MADLNKVRVQVIDPATGNVLDNVDVKTSDGAVYLPDGTTLRDWINNSETSHTEFQQKLAQHLAMNHVDADKVANLLTNVSYTEEDGKITFTKHDGTQQVIDTALEKLAVNFTVENGTGEEEGQKFLVLTLEDGSNMKVNVTDLVDVYTGSTGDNIVVTVNPDGSITATPVANSIGMELLTTDVINAINAQYTLPVASTLALGGIKAGGNIDIAADGTPTATNVKLGDTAANLVFVNATENVSLTATSATDTIISTTAGVTVPQIEIAATKTGDAAASATLSYQWFKKVIGTDIAFAPIDAATTATLPSASIDVANAGTTVYYCRVSATGTGVVANPVASKQFTVIVNAAA